MKKLYLLLGSYGLACILLALLFLLTFLGTLEQTQHGLYDVQKKYFESLVLVHWFGPIPLPLPGVYLILIVLGVNLVVGGLIRIRKSQATVGVIVIHVGILIMLAAGFVKLKFSADGHLTLFEGQHSDEYTSYYEWEIAITDATQTSNVTEYIIPEGAFSDLKGERTRTFQRGELPFRVTASHFARNGQVLPKGPIWKADSPVVDGYAIKAAPLEKEAEQNVAGLHVKIDEGAPREGLLWGPARFPLVVMSGGKAWAIDLRKKRFKMPFDISLDKFTHELYPGTRTPRSFMSDVTMTGSTSRKLKIEMNAPLREQGLTLFQASWGPEDAEPGQPLFSTFAVVENPSDQWPLISCIVIGLGMLIAFVQKLAKYIWAQSVVRK